MTIFRVLHDEWFPGPTLKQIAQKVEAKLTLDQEVEAKLWLHSLK